MNYSINVDRKELVVAQKADINASYKGMGAVCDAIRYMRADTALEILDDVADMKRPVLFRRHNKGMGARHELHGRKGRYPEKAAREVREVLVNAIANANNRGLDGARMFVVHACANKTMIARRYPSKGSLAWGRGMYGMSAVMHSDLEYAKVEVALATGSEMALSDNMRKMIKRRGQISPKKRPADKKDAKAAKKGKEAKEKIKA